MCRASHSITIFPNDYLSLSTGNSFGNEFVALDPRESSNVVSMTNWPKVQIIKIIDNEIRLTNDTDYPIHVPKNEQLCNIRSAHIIDTELCVSEPAVPVVPVIRSSLTTRFSDAVQVDPNKQLSEKWSRAFRELHHNFDSVFEPSIGRYNGYSGKLKARILFGSTAPPAKKLHAPTYSNQNLQLLQEKFDMLEAEGVLGRPEDHGVTVEHVSASFLVRKNSGGFRLVTAFTALSSYTKTLPTLMPTVDDMMRTISEWKYIITADLKDAFYQIPLAKESMKWCGTVTPFRGIRIYLVASQGLPGSSEWLEELLCLLLGDKVQEGTVAKVADDMFVGAETIEDLYKNWSDVLLILFKNGIKLKSPKTIIAPTHAQILGWDWNNGSITASSHKILPLSKCDPPSTVTALRSYIGAYKFFNRVIRSCAFHLDSLEKAIAGKQKNEKIIWTDILLEKFKASQKALITAAVITLPKQSDQIVIVHYGSHVGIGSVLYLKRKGVIKLGGFFSSKLKTHQVRWFPCEIEALSIAVSVSHFSPYIRNSTSPTQILTDNRPCVQAWAKMRRGEFSTSARVATFMATLSEFNIEVQHISGLFNLPSDFLSRNPLECDSQNCQLCKFISETESSVVRAVSVKDVLGGRTAVPFSNRAAWKNLQMECPDLRRLHAHLSNGTRPTAKNTKIGTVKRFLRNVTIARDGLLIVKQSQPFLPESELIVVPLRLLHGLITSLHIFLSHPTAHQLTNVFNRCYYSLNVSDCVTSVLQSCAQCQALISIPSELITQTSSISPTTPLLTYAADVLRRCKQFIFALRDTFSSFTIAQIHDNENHNTLRTALIVSISSIRANPQTSVEVRVDNAPGFKALKNDSELLQHNIIIDLGRVHNKNKNPVIEKGIRELSSEILRVHPEGGPLSAAQLAVVVNQLNARIRNRGLSSWEILNQRNQYTGEQIEINDLKLSEQQSQLKAANQAASAKHKARGHAPAENALVQEGSLVYIKSERDKHRARDRYLVTKVDNDSVTVQKFVKSQLRSQKYQLKLAEVYPVHPEEIIIPGMIRDLDTGREEEEEGDEVQVDYSVPPNDRYSSSSDLQLVSSPPQEVGACETSGIVEPADAASAEPVTVSTEVVPDVLGEESAAVPQVSVSAEFGVSEADVDLSVGRPRRACSRPRWMKDFVVDG